MILNNSGMPNSEHSVICSCATQWLAYFRMGTTTLASRRFDDRCVELIEPLRFPASRTLESV